MSTEKSAERETTLRERRAFSAGWNACHAKMSWPSDGEDRDAQIRERYPLPKTTRPLRGTFAYSDYTWYWDGADFRGKHPRYEEFSPVPFGRLAANLKSAADIALLARMLSGETETVEDDVSLLRDGGL